MSEFISREDRDADDAWEVELRVSIEVMVLDADGQVATLTMVADPRLIDPKEHLSEEIRAALSENVIDDVAGALDAIAQRSSWGREGVAP